MRKSVISSSVATIVAYANDRLVAAGVALRTILHRTNLHLTSMRGHMGNWQKPATAGLCERIERGGNKPSKRIDKPSSSLADRLGMAKRFSQVVSCRHLVCQRPMQVFALCPAYAAIARVAPKG